MQKRRNLLMARRIARLSKGFFLLIALFRVWIGGRKEARGHPGQEMA